MAVTRRRRHEAACTALALTASHSMPSVEFDLLCAFETHAVDKIRAILDGGNVPNRYLAS